MGTLDHLLDRFGRVNLLYAGWQSYYVALDLRGRHGDLHARAEISPCGEVVLELARARGSLWDGLGDTAPLGVAQARARELAAELRADLTRRAAVIESRLNDRASLDREGAVILTAGLVRCNRFDHYRHQGQVELARRLRHPALMPRDEGAAREAALRASDEMVKRLDDPRPWDLAEERALRAAAAGLPPRYGDIARALGAAFDLG